MSLRFIFLKQRTLLQDIFKSDSSWFQSTFHFTLSLTFNHANTLRMKITLFLRPTGIQLTQLGISEHDLVVALCSSRTCVHLCYRDQKPRIVVLRRTSMYVWYFAKERLCCSVISLQWKVHPVLWFMLIWPLSKMSNRAYHLPKNCQNWNIF